MRHAWWMLALVACHTQPQASAPATPTVVACPTCNDCAEPSCPERSCPACPESPTPKVDEFWHCHDLHRTTMPISGLCRPSEQACEYQRRDLIDRKIGKPGPCVTQKIAHCFLIYDPVAMNRQIMCARTAVNCEERRQWTQDKLLGKTDRIGVCVATPNTERFAFEKQVSSDLPALDTTP